MCHSIFNSVCIVLGADDAGTASHAKLTNVEKNFLTSELGIVIIGPDMAQFSGVESASKFIPPQAHIMIMYIHTMRNSLDANSATTLFHF